MNSNHITYEPASCNRQAGRGVVCLVKKNRPFFNQMSLELRFVQKKA